MHSMYIVSHEFYIKIIWGAEYLTPHSLRRPWCCYSNFHQRRLLRIFYVLLVSLVRVWERRESHYSYILSPIYFKMMMWYAENATTATANPSRRFAHSAPRVQIKFEKIAQNKFFAWARRNESSWLYAFY